MDKIKSPAVAGMFYPDSKSELQNLFNSWDTAMQFDTNYISRLVIAPHAGYIYSGKCAFSALRHIRAKNIFIFSPAHKEFVENAIKCDYNAFLTPMEQVSTNINILSKLDLNTKNSAYAKEHAIEVQLPILQYFLKNDFNIIPIIVGANGKEDVFKIIDKYWSDEECAFVISSDLSHYLNDKQALSLDNITAQMIEASDSSKFHTEQACGCASICAALDFAKKRNFSFIRLNMLNSSAATHDKSHVVGYGAWLLYEGGKNSYIAQFYPDILREIAYQSIKNKGRIDIRSYPDVLNTLGASFVTLEKHGDLRGCIGSPIAHQPLILDLIQNACSAAYRDPRFLPLTLDELSDIEIKISLLDEPKEIIFTDEEDLLNKITPHKDGIIIQDGPYRALYLPSVWEQLDDKKLFLNSHKQKAGLKSDYFSNTLKAFRFRSEYI